MRKNFYIVFSCLLSVALLACGRTDQSNLTPSGPQIVHGAMVKASEPLKESLVGIVIQNDEGEALCTGSLIAEDTVLTAAHCVDHNPGKITIVFNAKIKGSKAERTREASGFVQNSLWIKNAGSGKGERGDLALIRFAGGPPEKTQIVKLADGQLKLNKGDSVLVMGYGVTNGVKEAGSGTLREANTTIIGQTSKTEIATDGQQSSVCFGDSGGPGFAQTQDGVWVQWGVASAVANKSCDEASVHTDLRSYRTWITRASDGLTKKAPRD